MSNTKVLQIRADSSLITKAQKKAGLLGFSSLQEIVRVFLTNLVKGNVQEPFPAEYIHLGPKAKKRWEMILRDADHGKNMYSFDDPDEALSFLDKADV